MDKVESLVLEHLRYIRGRVDHLTEEVGMVNARLTSIDNALLTIRREIINTDEVDARLQINFDKLANRVEKIEARLEIS